LYGITLIEEESASDSDFVPSFCGFDGARRVILNFDAVQHGISLANKLRLEVHCLLLIVFRDQHPKHEKLLSAAT